MADREVWTRWASHGTPAARRAAVKAASPDNGSIRQILMVAPAAAAEDGGVPPCAARRSLLAPALLLRHTAIATAACAPVEGSRCGPSAATHRRPAPGCRALE